MFHHQRTLGCMLGRRLSQESSGVPVGSCLCSSCPSQLPSKMALPTGEPSLSSQSGTLFPAPSLALCMYTSSSSSSSSFLPLPFPQICVPNLLVPLTTSNPRLQTGVIGSCSLGPKRVNQSACHPWLFLPCQSSPKSVLPPNQQKVVFLLKPILFPQFPFLTRQQNS